MAMEGSGDDLLHHMIDCAVLFDDLLAAISEGVNDAIGQQNAQEGANERRSDHRAQDFRRLVDGAHRLDHAKDGRSEEHTSALQSLMSISYAGFSFKKKNN